MRNRMAIAAGILLASAMASSAHHTVTGFFDTSRFVTLQGTLTRVDWRAPHVILRLETRRADGSLIEWNFKHAEPAGAGAGRPHPGFLQGGREVPGDRLRGQRRHALGGDPRHRYAPWRGRQHGRLLGNPVAPTGRTIVRRAFGMAVLAVVIASGIPATAHHSNPLYFDMSKAITLEGEVLRVGGGPGSGSPSAMLWPLAEDRSSKRADCIFLGRV